MSADSHSFYHGDSLVSVFSMDRGAADQVKNTTQSQQTNITPRKEHARPSVDFEKEELRERITALEEKLAARDLDLAKAHKLIKGLHKLLPKPDNAAETPSFIDDRLSRDRANLLADLKSPAGSILITEEYLQQRQQQLPNTTAAMDLVMNGTLAPEDLQTMKYEFVRFRDLCTKMFQQLQGTATFLEKLIRHLESSDDEAAKQLLAKIKSIHLDLNTSMQDASLMIESSHTAEMSLNTALEKSIRISMAPNSEVIVLTDKIIEAEKKQSEMEKKYSVIVESVASLNEQNEKLQQQLLEATVKAENLQNVVTEKENQLGLLMEEKRMNEERAQNLVPEILQEMTNIKTTLENVSEASKHLAKERRRH